MHVEISQLFVVELSEIGVRILEDIAALLELSRAEPRFGVVLHGVGPREVIEPRARSNIAEDGAAIYVTDLASAIDVIDQLVIVSRVKARHVSVPFAEIAAALEIHLIVFPNTNDRRRFLHDLGSLFHGVETDLMQPTLGRIIAALLVQPVAIQDGEMHLVTHLLIECVKHRQRGPGAVTTAAVVVTAGEFEFEIKQPFRVALGVLKIRRARQGAKRAAQLMIDHAVVVARVGLQFVQLENACVIAGDVRGLQHRFAIEGILVGAEQHLYRPGALRAHPQAHGIGGRPAEHGSMRHTNGGG